MQALVHFADSLVDDFDIIDLLTVLADQTVELGAADVAGILLVDDDGFLRVIAASSEKTQLLELFQLQNEEGPCLEAFATGTVVVHGNLPTAAERWPRFGPLAVSAGFRSVAALPLRLHQRNIGTFSLFGELNPVDVVLGQVLAEVAAIAILQDHTIRNMQAKVSQLQHALNSRIVIEQAKGMISERARVDMDEAFARLRRYARAHQVRLTDVACQVTKADRLLDELAISPRSS